MNNTQDLPLNRSFLSRLFACLALGFAFAIGGLWPSAALAADGTWIGSSGASWSTPSSWFDSSIPGATTGTTNTDTALFDLNLTAAQTIIVDAGRNLQNITFGANNTSNFGYNFSPGTPSVGSLFLTSGGTILMQGTTGTQITSVSVPITLQGDGGSYTIQNDSTPATRLLYFNGAVTGVSTAGNTTTLTLAGSNTGSNKMNSVISDGGSGGKVAVVKNGVGTWFLATANTFTGGFTLNAGTVISNQFNNALGNGSLTLNGGTLVMQGGVTGTSLAINDNVTIKSDSAAPGVGVSRTLNGGLGGITIATGKTVTITAGDNVTSGTATVNSTGITTSGNVTFSINNTAGAAAQLLVSGATLGGGALIFTGNGNVSFSAVMSGAGGLTLDSGFSGTFNTSSGLSYSGATLISSGSTLKMTGYSSFGSSAITNNGTFEVSRPSNASVLNFTTGMSGTGRLLLSGTGATNKVGFNTVAATYTGDTIVDSGNLFISGNGTLTTSAIKLTGSIVSELNIASVTPGSATIKSLAGVAGSTVTLGAKTLIVGDSTSTTYGGVISGTGGVTKQGSGAMTLSGSNTYTGTTLVTVGTLVIDGSLASTSVSVSSGAKLDGSGTLANATISGAGQVGPGNSPGILTASQVNPSGGLGFNFEFTATGAPTWNNATASVNDVLRLTNATTPFTTILDSDNGNAINFYLGVSSLTPNTFYQGGFFTDLNTDFLASISQATLAYYVLGNGLGTHAYNDVNYYTLAEYNALVSGSFSVNLGTIQVGSADFQSGTVSNGWVSQLEVVPEPGTWALFAFGLATVMILRRRRARG